MGRIYVAIFSTRLYNMVEKGGAGPTCFRPVFQDADKRPRPRLLPQCIRVRAPGGVFPAAGALFRTMDFDQKRQDLTAPTEEFGRWAAGSRELAGALLPIGDGLIRAVKKD